MKKKSVTPILDKYNLHAFGGYCTCYSNPYGKCAICAGAAEHQKQWNALTPEERKQAEKEQQLLDEANPSNYSL